MIKISLLSPSDRLSAKWEKINNLIISNFLILIIGQLVLVFILFISIKHLDIENRKLNKQLENMQAQSEIKRVKEIKNSIKGYDKQSKTILELQEDRFVFTGFLENFSNIIPLGVRINSIDIKPKINKAVKKGQSKKNVDNEGKFDFNIVGTAKNRESLLEFENNLRNSKIFTDLIVDLSNYNSKNNDFRYGATIDINQS